MDYLFILIGLTGLFFGGEALVRGSVSIARRLSISPFVIGLTIVGFGTSTPELLVSVEAALRGVPDIAIGNILGSNIANVLLIVGATAMIWPIRVQGQSLKRDVAVMLASGLFLIPLFAMAEVGRLAGMFLVGVLGFYLVLTFLKAEKEVIDTEIAPVPATVLIPLLWVGLGFVALLMGARFLVDGAVSVARASGVSEAFIGLTIVAVGTSLPELATSLIAAVRRQSDIAIGNIVGSNIFNVLGILGVTAVIAPIPVADRFLTFDLPIMIAVSLVLACLLLARPQIGRPVGILFLAGYGAYVVLAQ